MKDESTQEVSVGREKIQELTPVGCTNVEKVRRRAKEPEEKQSVRQEEERKLFWKPGEGNILRKTCIISNTT